MIRMLSEFDPSAADHESIGTTEDMESANTDDEGTITDEHISPRVCSYQT